MARDIKKAVKKVDDKEKDKIINSAASEKQIKPKTEKEDKFTTNISIKKSSWIKGKQIALEEYGTTNFSKFIEILIEEKKNQLNK